MTDEEITEKIHALKIRLMRECVRHKNKTFKIENEIFDIMKVCPHNKISFNSDPSGNNDSFMECLICGKEVKRL